MRRALPLLLLLTAAGCGTDISGPAPSLFSCLLTDPRSLEPGDVLQLRGAAHQGLCLDSPTAGEYLYVPFFASRADGEGDDAVRLDLELTGHGLAAPVADAPAPAPQAPLSLGPAPAIGATTADAPAAVRRPDHRFHERLRARERQELEPLIRSPAGDGRSRSRDPRTRDVPVGADPAAADLSAAGRFPTAAELPVPGTLIDYNVAISCTEADVRTGRVQYVSDAAIVVADIENPPAMLDGDFRHFGETFDTLVYPLGTAHFGAPSDIDGNGRVVIFFTRAVNELTPPGSDTYTGGFFWSGDLFPEAGTDRLEGCPAANEAEMFYMLVPDPAGVAGPPFPVEFIREIGVTILAHELQHLINASRRLYVHEAGLLEDGWLNEGLSHIAEELLFYRAAGLTPGLNLTAQDLRDAPGAVTAFNRYLASGNFTNLLRYLVEPDTASLMGAVGLTTRGATWAFLRYAADRSGRTDDDFFYDIVNSRVSGLANLGEVLGEAAVEWMQDWTVSVHADDHVANVAPQYTQPSWHYRDLYDALAGGYPLALVPLAPGQPHRLELRPGGAAFVALEVAGGGRAVLHIEADGGAPPPALRGSFLRIR